MFIQLLLAIGWRQLEDGDVGLIIQPSVVSQVIKYHLIYELLIADFLEVC